MASVTVSFNTDENVKKELDRIATEIGISTSALLNILVKRTVMENGIPFAVKADSEGQDFNETTSKFDEETQKAIIKEMAIEVGLLPDDSKEITDVEAYFKSLGY